MYKYVNGMYTNDCCSKQKTARLDPETLEIIENYKGKNFSDKLRNLVRDYARHFPEIVRQKQEQEGSENGRSDVHTSIF